MDMSKTVMIRPRLGTPATAVIYHLGEQEKQIAEGPLDPAIDLKTYIRKHLKKELKKDNRNIILDLRAVEWIDSTYVGMILAWHQLVEAEGGRFALVNLSGRSKDIMRVTRLDATLNVFDSVSEAGEYFSRAA